MKEFSFLITFLTLFIIGCGEKRDLSSPKKVHWDRDMCQRCKMVLSDRKFAVEIIEPKSGKVYYFDDIGCAVLWLEEEKIGWAKDAKIWVRNLEDSSWIDGKNALFVGDIISPMAYGFGAYSKDKFPKDKKAYRFDEVKRVIKLIEQKNNQKRRLTN